MAIYQGRRGGDYMAVIHKRKNKLNENLHRQNLTIYLSWISYFVIIFFAEENYAGIGFFLSSLITMYAVKRKRIIKNGIEGERKALEIVKNLSDDYHVFVNWEYEYEGRKSETDLIVVSNKGVFIVEVKNHNGHIVGKERDMKWRQHKVGKNGGKYYAEMYNPTKQVGTQVWRLSKNFRDEKIRVWVQGIVYFVNENVEIEVDSKRTPVFTNKDDLKDYIENLDVKNKVRERTFKRIIEKIENL